MTTSRWLLTHYARTRRSRHCVSVALSILFPLLRFFEAKIPGVHWTNMFLNFKIQIRSGHSENRTYSTTEFNHSTSSLFFFCVVFSLLPPRSLAQTCHHRTWQSVGTEGSYCALSLSLSRYRSSPYSRERASERSKKWIL